MSFVAAAQESTYPQHLMNPAKRAAPSRSAPPLPLPPPPHRTSHNARHHAEDFAQHSSLPSTSKLCLPRQGAPFVRHARGSAHRGVAYFSGCAPQTKRVNPAKAARVRRDLTSASRCSGRALAAGHGPGFCRGGDGLRGLHARARRQGKPARAVVGARPASAPPCMHTTSTKLPCTATDATIADATHQANSMPALLAEGTVGHRMGGRCVSSCRVNVAPRAEMQIPEALEGTTQRLLGTTPEAEKRP